ncbi:hypothetical protein VPHD479_0272 [Vibrio phage D479]
MFSLLCLSADEVNNTRTNYLGQQKIGPCVVKPSYRMRSMRAYFKSPRTPEGICAVLKLVQNDFDVVRFRIC